MIRKWVITGLIAAAVLYLLYDFTVSALLYNPLKGLERTGNAQARPSQADAKYKSAWATEILQKNLFSPDRRHTPMAEKQKAMDAAASRALEIQKPKAERLPITLNGIIVDDEGRHVAYLKEGEKAAFSLRKGEEMAGIRIVEIDERSVIIERDGQRTKLEMLNIKSLKR